MTGAKTFGDIKWVGTYDTNTKIPKGFTKGKHHPGLWFLQLGASDELGWSGDGVGHIFTLTIQFNLMEKAAWTIHVACDTICDVD